MSLSVVINLILLVIIVLLALKINKTSLMNTNSNLPQPLDTLKNEFDIQYHSIIDDIIEQDTYNGYKILLSKLKKNSEQYEQLKDKLTQPDDVQNDALNELNKKNEEIMYISHQMRTSLSGLISFTDFLKKTNMTEEQEDFHLAISQSAQELLKLANNMMDAKVDTRHPIEILNINNINHKVKEITENKTFSEVLVVDDNPINRKLMKHILNDFDVTVTLAENGQEAIELREQKDFDIIFMDIEMPIMNGVEATISIRKYEKVYKKKESYIVAVTGQYEKEIYIDSGMNDYIPKPIAIEEIKQRLDTL